jgi:peroxiredoxin
MRTLPQRLPFLIAALSAAFILTAPRVRAQAIQPQPPQALPVGLDLETAPMSASALPAGAQAPDFTLKDMSGNAVSLSGLKGKVVMLEFWATWCGPCRQSMPLVEALHQKYASKGLVILAISIDQDADDVKDHLKNHSYSFKVLHDYPNNLKTALAYNNGEGRISIPKSVLIGKDGKIILGETRPEDSGLAPAIEKALK